MIHRKKGSFQASAPGKQHPMNEDEIKIELVFRGRNNNNGKMMFLLFESSSQVMTLVFRGRRDERKEKKMSEA